MTDNKRINNYKIHKVNSKYLNFQMIVEKETKENNTPLSKVN